MKRLRGWLIAASPAAASICFRRVMEDDGAMGLTTVVLWSWAVMEIFEVEVT